MISVGRNIVNEKYGMYLLRLNSLRCEDKGCGKKHGRIRNTFENWVRDGWGHWQGYTTNLRVERGELSFRQFVGGTERLRMLIENI